MRLLVAISLAALLMISSAQAGCDNSDRPKLPSSMNVSTTPTTVKIQWITDKEVYYDISLTPRSGGPAVLSMTGEPVFNSAGKRLGNLEVDVPNLAPKTDYIFHFFTRSEKGFEGCISGTGLEFTVTTAAPPSQPPPPPPPTAGGCAGLSGDELDICNEHNAKRAVHGVPALNWSADLAMNAKNWVKDCHTAKNNNGDAYFCHQSSQYGCGTDASYHYGENLSFGWPMRSGKEAVDSWYCEINIYDFDHPKVQGGVIFGCGPNENPDKVTGHFTQVIWRGSTKLGCAKNTCTLGSDTGTLWACEYDPPGNFNADQPGVLDQNVPRPVQGITRAAILPVTDLSSQRVTAVISDVDLYDIPGGIGKVIGVLRQGQEYPLIQCRADDWCQISRGWVWGSFLLRNHSH